MIFPPGFVKFVVLIILNKYDQNVSTPKRISPIQPAKSQASIRFLLSSFGVHIALKRVVIHAIESAKRITPKLPFISFLRIFAISAGSIPNTVTKNCASPGLNTT